MKLHGINSINMIAFTNKSVGHILIVPAHSLECESQISERFTKEVQYNKSTGQEQGGYTVLMVEIYLLPSCTMPPGWLNCIAGCIEVIICHHSPAQA